MKLKGISIIEQHIDKIVIGVAGLICVGIATIQFFGRNEVRLESRSVTPAEVDPLMSEKAASIAAKLRDDAASESNLQIGTLKKAAEQFTKGVDVAVSPQDSLPTIQPQLYVLVTTAKESAGDAWYSTPKLAPPTMLSPVTQTADALADGVVEKHTELAALFPDLAAPKDMTWTIPAAIVPIGQYRAELHKSEASANPPKVQIPTSWYNDTLSMLDIAFEREELQADGSWGQMTLVPVLPDNFTLRPTIAGVVDAGLKQRILEMLGDRVKQFMILQPSFFPTKNEAFTPPTAQADANVQDAAAQSLIARLKKRIADRQAQIATEEKRLEGLGGPLEEEKEADKEKDGKGKGKTPNAIGGGGGAPAEGGGQKFGGQVGPRVKDNKDVQGADQKGEDKEAKDKLRIRLTKKLKKLKEGLARMLDELKKEGGTMDELVVKKPVGGSGDLDKDDQLVVWAHDINVKPGQTYRYRCIVKTYNPFFARSRQLVAEQAKLADSIVMDSPASEWSPQVEITPPVRFFVTHASTKAADGPLGLGSATIEIFRLYNGERRSERFPVQPGDRIGKIVEGKSVRGGPAEPTIDFSTDWYVVAIVDDLNDHSGSTSVNGERGAVVIVKRLGTGETLELRDPGAEMASGELGRLRDEVG